MRVLFMGTPDFAVAALKAIMNAGHTVVGAVTQPDKPKGRHLHLEPPPVKLVALEACLPVYQPQKLTDGFKSTVAPLTPDVVVVAAYGKIIPKWLLELPRHGCINIHASLLPKYRGAAPVQRAIMSGEEETGITIMQIDEGLDTGDILLQEKISIGPNETASELESRLARLGAKLLVETLDKLAEGASIAQPQDGSQATYAAKIEKEETMIDWSVPAEKIRNTIRALNPHPGAHTYYQGMRVKIWRAELDLLDLQATSQASVPGTVLFADSRSGLVVATATNPLRLEEVQPEGKNRMSGAEFVRGYRLSPGDRLA